MRVNVLYYMPVHRCRERQLAHVFMGVAGPYAFDLHMKSSFIECEKMSPRIAEAQSIAIGK
ncbi:hypothetical protein GCM10010096_32700 [Alcaligenes pakistanensis]|uniref:Uncharacterized protein n=1 Tax=Alcaligenes pakistanensis TaxID=1482717 RepID=A0A8H9M8Y1_9BURK|nr:hypothetical protein GCM10010096_32700 [Alcaligenes pakistanensis]